jgi:UDP-GlcNAc:undecaprenyl-phosphate GlcNAc-1-phosphate transferase
MEFGFVIRIAVGMVFAFLIAFAVTPIVRKISVKVGAIDIPKDNRRMHSVPIPTMGGIGIFIAFAFGVLAFVPLDKTYFAMLAGCLFITLVGMLDDIFGLKWWVKLLGQIGAALVVAVNGIVINQVGYGAVQFGIWAIPVTVLWIVAITNAINLIDGLDGLACGIVGISCISLLVVSSFYMDPQHQSIMIVIGVLAGSCFGFLPYNTNPAKIFMGDTGAM